MKRWSVIVGAALLMGLVLALWGGPLSEALGDLVLGWVAYLARVLPRVRVAWEGVATALVCLVLFSIWLHRTLRWLYAELRKSGGRQTEPERSWQPRWTASLVALIVVVFAVGIAAAGIAHQAAWLVGSRRSLVEPRSESSTTGNLRMMQFGVEVVRQMHAVREEEARHSESAPLQSWQTEILPYLSFVLGGQLDRDWAWDAPENSAYFRGVVPLYLNSEVNVIRSPKGYALSHFAGNVHVLGQRLPRGPSDFPAGASNTILAGEVAGGFKPWGDPTNLRDPALGINSVRDGFGGPSGRGANVVFLDGSVRFLKPTMDRQVLHKLSTARAGR